MLYSQHSNSNSMKNLTLKCKTAHPALSENCLDFNQHVSTSLKLWRDMLTENLSLPVLKKMATAGKEVTSRNQPASKGHYCRQLRPQLTATWRKSYSQLANIWMEKDGKARRNVEVMLLFIVLMLALATGYPKYSDFEEKKHSDVVGYWILDSKGLL